MDIIRSLGYPRAMDWTKGIRRWDWLRRLAMLEVLSEKLSRRGLSVEDIRQEIINLNYNDNLNENIIRCFGDLSFSDKVLENWDVFVVILEYIIEGNVLLERSWSEREFTQGVERANEAVNELYRKVNSAVLF